MDLVEHARAELSRLREDSDLILPILKVVLEFQAQDFNPLARGFAVEYLHQLLREKPLSVLTDDPQEWEKLPDQMVWQSRRDPEARSLDGGKTFWLRSDAEICDPEPPPRYVAAPRDMVMMPETYRDALKMRTSMEQPDLVPSPGGGGDEE